MSQGGKWVTSSPFYLAPSCCLEALFNSICTYQVRSAHPRGNLWHIIAITTTDLHYQSRLLLVDTARRTCSKYSNCPGSTTPYWRPLSESTSPKPHRSSSSSTSRQVCTLFVSCFLVSACPRNEICFLSSIEKMVWNLLQPCFRWPATSIQGAALTHATTVLFSGDNYLQTLHR